METMIPRYTDPFQGTKNIDDQHRYIDTDEAQQRLIVDLRRRLEIIEHLQEEMHDDVEGLLDGDHYNTVINNEITNIYQQIENLQQNGGSQEEIERLYERIRELEERVSVTPSASAGSLLMSGLHHQHHEINYRSEHRSAVGTYVRLVSARSTNVSKTTFMFEMISREANQVTYYAKVLFNGRSMNFELMLLESDANSGGHDRFRPLDDLVWTKSGSDSNCIINVYRRVRSGSEDFWIVNTLQENSNGMTTRSGVFTDTTATGYSIHFWPWGGDSDYGRADATHYWQRDCNLTEQMVLQGASDGMLHPCSLATHRQHTAPTAHSHTKNDITDFAHTHEITDVSGLSDLLTSLTARIAALEAAQQSQGGQEQNQPAGIGTAAIGSTLVVG